MFYSSNQPNIHKQFNVPQSTNRPSHNKFVNILLQRGIKIDLCGSPCTFHITLNAQVFGSHTKATNHWQSDKSCHSKAITQQEYNYRSNQLTNSVCRLISKLCNFKSQLLWIITSTKTFEPIYQNRKRIEYNYSLRIMKSTDFITQTFLNLNLQQNDAEYLVKH